MLILCEYASLFQWSGTRSARLAAWVEHAALDRGVVSSSPALGVAYAY